MVYNGIHGIHGIQWYTMVYMEYMVYNGIQWYTMVYNGIHGIHEHEYCNTDTGAFPLPTLSSPGEPCTPPLPLPAVIPCAVLCVSLYFISDTGANTFNDGGLFGQNGYRYSFHGIMRYQKYYRVGIILV